MQTAWLGYARGVAGAFAGGVAGYFAFTLLLRQGFYALALPGALLGFGCGLASRIDSVALAALCGIAGILLAIWIEWHFFPFADDKSLSHFFGNLHRLTGLTQLMIVLSGVFGFWFGKGRPRPAS